ncbi:MAG: DUF4082 domain-containing protein [Bdellovibrionaceae bacterium]|nr:DUF4082 domain-containing protein [Pseudobdellovibrionaceae bacterium]
MKRIKILLAVLSLTVNSCTGDGVIRSSLSSSSEAQEDIADPTGYCPRNFVRVPANPPFAAHDFCLSKYEMKIRGNDNGDQPYDANFVAESRSGGTPWVGVTQAEAQAECRALGAGYDLMSNTQWQAVARNIEQVAWNWSGAAVGSAGGLSRSIGMTAGTAAARDAQACAGTGQACDLSTWNSHRRVQRLSNGQYVWDLAGNVAEILRGDWFTDPVFAPQDTALSQFSGARMKMSFGPQGNYAALNAEPFGGLGDGLGAASNGLLVRGGAWGSGNPGAYNAGLFSVNTNVSFVTPNNSVGFRCIRHPTNAPEGRIFTAENIPEVPVAADFQGLELGVQFQADVNGKIHGVRFYRGATQPGGYTVSLWTAGGILIDSAAGPEGTLPDWQEVRFATPVSINANTTYVASYFATGGEYAYTFSALTTEFKGPYGVKSLAGGGVFNVGAGFPNSVFGTPSYYVDVIFVAD